MWRRLPWRRAEVLLGAVTLAAFSVEFWKLADERAGDAILPLLWPVLTGMSAVLVLGVAICPRWQI